MPSIAEMNLNRVSRIESAYETSSKNTMASGIIRIGWIFGAFLVRQRL
jgi:hypothetical protein